MCKGYECVWRGHGGLHRSLAQWGQVGHGLLALVLRREGVAEAEGKGCGGTAKCETGDHPVGGYDGYAPLVETVIQFFKSGKPPVAARETLEIYAFMQAADDSKAANGKEVPLKLDWE